MSGLQHVGDPSEPACAACGAPAAGPCASCRRMVCGDCCVLTEGGVETWAICLRCDGRKGRSLAGGWGLVLRWFVGLLGLLLALAVATVWSAR